MVDVCLRTSKRELTSAAPSMLCYAVLTPPYTPPLQDSLIVPSYQAIQAAPFKKPQWRSSEIPCWP